MAGARHQNSACGAGTRRRCAALKSGKVAVATWRRDPLRPHPRFPLPSTLVLIPRPPLQSTLVLIPRPPLQSTLVLPPCPPLPSGEGERHAALGSAATAQPCPRLFGTTVSPLRVRMGSDVHSYD